jgi:hypothetical protein
MISLIGISELVNKKSLKDEIKLDLINDGETVKPDCGLFQKYVNNILVAFSDI